MTDESKRATPETDAFYRLHPIDEYEQVFIAEDDGRAWIDFARDLETRLSKAEEERDDHQKQGMHNWNRAIAAERRIAELEAQVNTEWLVWSHEHQGYWPQDECGYVTLAKAGRFTFKNALAIVMHGSYGMRGQPEETMMPVPTAWLAAREKEKSHER